MCKCFKVLWEKGFKVLVYQILKPLNLLTFKPFINQSDNQAIKWLFRSDIFRFLILNLKKNRIFADCKLHFLLNK